MNKFYQYGLKIFIILSFLFLYAAFASYLFAYNFSADSSKLSEDMRAQGITPASVKMAIVFDVVDQSNLKQRTNLVQLKKDLSYAVSSIYNTADPTITQEIIERNNISTQELKTNPTLRSEFAGRNDANYLLFVSIVPEPGALAITYNTTSSMGIPVSQFVSRHPIESLETSPFAQTQPVQPPQNNTRNTYSESAFSSFGSSFLNAFPLGLHNRMSNDTWFYFQQSAIPLTQIHSLELALWAEDITKVHLPLKRIRYDLRYDRFQFGIQGYWAEDSIDKSHNLHSTYISLKANIIDDQMFRFPIYLSLGGKRNITWRKENPEFMYQGNKDVEDDNKSKNLNSLFIALSFRLDEMGLIFNTYYDNVFFTAGAKLILHNNIRLLYDYEYLHIQTDYDKSDHGIFLEILSSENLIFYIGYQVIPEQTLVGFKLAVF